MMAVDAFRFFRRQIKPIAPSPLMKSDSLARRGVGAKATPLKVSSVGATASLLNRSPATWLSAVAESKSVVPLEKGLVDVGKGATGSE
jgi:hypothetical protein